MAGAIFAAGVADHQAVVVALAPVPLFLGVLHMVRSAKLQLSMATYLAARTPPEAVNWERDIAVVRPLIWNDEHKKLKELRRDSAYVTWYWTSLAIGMLVLAVVGVGEFSHRFVGLVIGVAVLLSAAILLAREIRQIEPLRDRWDSAWAGHRDDDA